MPPPMIATLLAVIVYKKRAKSDRFYKDKTPNKSRTLVPPDNCIFGQTILPSARSMFVFIHSPTSCTHPT
jgi:hypothetical protein